MNKINFPVDVFIQGKEINLIVVDEKLINNSNWYRWFNDEKQTQTQHTMYTPILWRSKKTFRKYIKC